MVIQSLISIKENKAKFIFKVKRTRITKEKKNFMIIG